jgi:hypothetical protein
MSGAAEICRMRARDCVMIFCNTCEQHVLNELERPKRQQMLAFSASPYRLRTSDCSNENEFVAADCREPAGPSKSR